MNWTFLISLLKGSNTYETVVKILTVVAGFLAARDSDNTGQDDILVRLCGYCRQDACAPVAKYFARFCRALRENAL